MKEGETFLPTNKASICGTPQRLQGYLAHNEKKKQLEVEALQRSSGDTFNLNEFSWPLRWGDICLVD